MAEAEKGSGNLSDRLGCKFTGTIGAVLRSPKFVKPEALDGAPRLDRPKQIDPRLHSVTDYVNRLIDKTPEHDRQDQILAVLKKPRTAAALREMTSVLPRTRQLSYEPEVLMERARKRIENALTLARRTDPRILEVGFDLGCGRAENADILKSFGFTSYIGLDIDDKLFPERTPDMQLLKASAEEIPLSNDCVDFAVSFNVLEHVTEPKKALREIVRILRPGGVFYTQFGPPFNAATGPHLTRQLDLPYLHHLYPDEVMAEFTKRDDPYFTVNKKPLSYYREMFFAEDGFSLRHYREAINGHGFWLLKVLPSLRSSMPLDELATTAITAVVKK